MEGVYKMLRQEITTLTGLIDILSNLKGEGGSFANLQEVLNMLMDLDVKDEYKARLRYSYKHLVPCGSRRNPNRIALISYNDTDNELESNSYIIDFFEAKEDINWESNVSFNVWTKRVH
jgi:hypothetical protein